MGIEAELKARVRDPKRVRTLLGKRAAEEISVYADTYLDTPDHALTRDGRELRVRVATRDDETTTLLTLKGAAVDAVSGSKPETETTIADPVAMRAILTGLGFEVLIAFEKHCRNYRFTARDRMLLATLVHVPELAGTFIEIEAIVDTEAEVVPALEVIRSVLAELSIGREDETTETYTDAVAARRAGGPPE